MSEKLVPVAIFAVILALIYLNLVDEKVLYDIAVRVVKPVSGPELSRLESILTQNRLTLIRWAFLAGMLSLLFAGILLWRHRRSIVEWFRTNFRISAGSLKRELPLLPIAIWLTFCIYLAISIFLVVVLPVHHDEAYTYIYYIDKGTIPTLVLYNSWNNHILFNVIASFFNLIPFSDVKFLRLLNIVFGVILLFYSFFQMRRLFNSSVALFGIFVLVSFTPFINYSTHLRGYLLYTLLGAICTMSAYEILSGNYKKSRTYSISAVLGTYTMPSFVYIVVPQILVFLLGRAPIRYIARLGVWILSGVFVLYLPILILNGFDALYPAESLSIYELEVSDRQWWPYYKGFLQFLGHPYLIGIVTLLSLYHATQSKHHRRLHQIILAIFLASLLFPVLQGIQVPYRIFTYLLFPTLITLCTTVANLSSRMLFGLILVNCVFYYLNVNSIIRSEQYPREVETLYQHISKNASIIFVHAHPTLRVGLLYRAQDTHMKIDFSGTKAAFIDTICGMGYHRIYSLTPIACPDYTEHKTKYWIEYIPLK